MRAAGTACATAGGSTASGANSAAGRRDALSSSRTSRKSRAFTSLIDPSPPVLTTIQLGSSASSSIPRIARSAPVALKDSRSTSLAERGGPRVIDAPAKPVLQECEGPSLEISLVEEQAQGRPVRPQRARPLMGRRRVRTTSPDRYPSGATLLRHRSQPRRQPRKTRPGTMSVACVSISPELFASTAFDRANSMKSTSSGKPIATIAAWTCHREARPAAGSFGRREGTKSRLSASRLNVRTTMTTRPRRTAPRACRFPGRPNSLGRRSSKRPADFRGTELICRLAHHGTRSIGSSRVGGGIRHRVNTTSGECEVAL